LNKKKILALTCNIPYSQGGSGDQVDLFYLIKSLADRYDVYNIALYDEMTLPKDFSFKLVHSSLKGEVLHTGSDSNNENGKRKTFWDRYSHLFQIILGRYKQIDYETVHANAIQSRMNEVLRESPFDLIFIEQGGGIPLARTTVELSSNVPVLFAIEDLISLNKRRDVKVRKGILNKLIHYQIYRIMKKYESSWYSRIGFIAAISDVEAVYLQKLLPNQKKIHVLARGTDTSYFYPGKSKRYPSTLIFTGTMRWKSNVDAVVWFSENVVPALIEKIEGFKFYIVGRSPSKRVQDLNSVHITVTGEVEDVRPYVWSSSIYVAPMITGAGTKTKIFEALAMGQVIVCSDLALEGINQKVRDCVVVANTTGEYIHEIQELLIDKDRANKMSKKARDFAGKYYSWDMKGPEFCRLVTHIINSRK